MWYFLSSSVAKLHRLSVEFNDTGLPMESNIAMGLIYNTTLLLSLSIVYYAGYAISEKYKRIKPYLIGLLIGAVGLCIMSFPFKLVTGVIFDTRSILIGVSALIFGPYPTVVAVVITAGYRVILGGSGTLMGITVIALSAAIGLGWRRWLFRYGGKLKFINLYLLGLALHIAMLACTALLPWPSSQQVFRDIWLPVIIIYPVATVLLSTVLLQQKQRQESIQRIAEAEGRYRSLFDNNHATMMLVDPSDGRIIDANPAACRFYGWPATMLKGMNISQINTLSKEEIQLEMDLAAREKRNHFLFRHRNASGGEFDVEVYSGPINIGGKTLLFSLVHDVSKRVAYEKAMIASENRFRLLVEGAPDAIFIQTEYKFAYVNSAAISLFGAGDADQLVGRPVMERFHPDYHSLMQQRIYQLNYWKKSAPPNETLFVRLDGSTVFVEVSAVPIRYNNKDGAIVFARDISERKRMERHKLELEAQLRQQQKLEAIGTLAGGVAHEINNPINGIMNYAELILEQTDTDNRQSEYAREIIHETERVSVIVKNLLQFSRHEKQSHSYASIYDIINQTISLIKTIIRKDQIELVMELEDGLPDIKCRSQQIQQVLMNLLTNARDALNERFSGFDEDKMIRLSCEQYESEGRRWVRIVVEDHGCGIPDEVKDKIFEPFFSTKPKENGTGLGLSISYGIVKDHHGALTYQSMPGRTKAVLELPVDNGWVL